jgi:hypothetical protein
MILLSLILKSFFLTLQKTQKRLVQKEVKEEKKMHLVNGKMAGTRIKALQSMILKEAVLVQLKR